MSVNSGNYCRSTIVGSRVTFVYSRTNWIEVTHVSMKLKGEIAFELKVRTSSLDWKVVGERSTSFGSVKGYGVVNISHFVVQHVSVVVSEN